MRAKKRVFFLELPRKRKERGPGEIGTAEGSGRTHSRGKGGERSCKRGRKKSDVRKEALYTGRFKLRKHYSRREGWSTKT